MMMAPDMVSTSLIDGPDLLGPTGSMGGLSSETLAPVCPPPVLESRETSSAVRSCWNNHAGNGLRRVKCAPRWEQSADRGPTAADPTLSSRHQMVRRLLGVSSGHREVTTMNMLDTRIAHLEIDRRLRAAGR